MNLPMRLSLAARLPRCSCDHSRHLRAGNHIGTDSFARTFTRHVRRQPQQRRSRAAEAVRPHARQAQAAPPPIYREQLSDPAHIGAKNNSSVPVQDRGAALSLHNYMTLPIEQYDELDPEMIRSLGGNRYSLAVPRTSLFNVWVEPIVEVEVNLALTGAQRAVIIQATNWGLRGSDLVENLNLSRRFSLDFRAVLTWTTAAEKQAMQSGNGSVPAAVAGVVSAAGPAEVQGRIDLDVYSEVLGPFKIIPRGVLEAGGNSVMGALVNNLLPLFLRRLVLDYERWATDDAYRKKRAQRADSTALRG